MTTNEETLNNASDKSGDEPKPETGAASAVDAIVAERDQMRDQLLRTAADFDNYRKRTRREIDDAKVRGRDDAIKEVLPVFDNLERAVSAASNAQTIDSVVEGVKMVLKLFDDTAERMGLTRVKTVGERFDPAVHEAIQQQETDASAPGTILAEVVPGYQVGPRLLRAAMVVVARKPSGKPADGGTPSGNGPAPGDVSSAGNGAADGGHNG
ncbi:MAG TPA: nucleotide exchange factor GrpE [Polyangiales bacterium]|nr:nucleotide exchange factor GrpE [Polyangiales bacterium]